MDTFPKLEHYGSNCVRQMKQFKRAATLNEMPVETQVFFIVIVTGSGLLEQNLVLSYSKIYT